MGKNAISVNINIKEVFLKPFNLCKWMHFICKHGMEKEEYFQKEVSMYTAECNTLYIKQNTSETLNVCVMESHRKNTSSTDLTN